MGFSLLTAIICHFFPNRISIPGSLDIHARVTQLDKLHIFQDSLPFQAIFAALLCSIRHTACSSRCINFSPRWAIFFTFTMLLVEFYIYVFPKLLEALFVCFLWSKHIFYLLSPPPTPPFSWGARTTWKSTKEKCFSYQIVNGEKKKFYFFFCKGNLQPYYQTQKNTKCWLFP